MSDSKIVVRDQGAIREIRLNRPDVHNALDEDLIEALTGAFEEVTAAVEEATGDESFWVPGNGHGEGPPTAYDVPGVPRGIILSGEGASFCSGADIEYMRRIGQRNEAENLADARRVSRLFQAIRGCPVYTIARVQGAALGGGTGLLAACDLAVSADDCTFGFTEVQLGILPCVISPFVLDRIGPTHGRAWFPTGERFDAATALRIGLVNRVVPAAELDSAIASTVKVLLSAAPSASRQAKRLVEMVAFSLPLQLDLEQNLGSDQGSSHPHDCDDPTHDHDEEYDEHTSVFDETARWIAALRAGAEGREGLAAFLEKRKPGWFIPPK
ncbi:MAG: enoyl-CoA hydratase/isomerase family protein [Candidatus Eisenbacteria bacterium]|nr:enoyl-CoA hydratase/isomerase family protein [Candidatus Eisenbacteria bacterium]